MKNQVIVIRNFVAFVILMSFSLKSEAQCNIRVRLTMIAPAYCADGWSGMRITVTKNGAAVAGLTNITLPNSCGPLDFNFTAVSGDVIRVNRVANGFWPNDNRVEVTNMSSGVTMQAAHLPPASPTLGAALTVAAGCPVPAPMAITGIAVDQISADIQNFVECPELSISHNEYGVLRVRITTSAGTPIALTQFNTSYNGTAPLSAITDTRVYEGDANSFWFVQHFGTSTSPSATPYNINGNKNLSSGDNYYWIVYNLNSNLNSGNTVDAILHQFTAGGTTYTTGSTPALNTTNPVGSRLCVPCTTPCTHRLILYDNATYGNGTAGGQIQVYVDGGLVGTWGPLESSGGEQTYLETWFSAPPGATIRVVRSIAGTEPANMRYWVYTTVPFALNNGDPFENDIPDFPSSITSAFNRIIQGSGYENWMYAQHITPVAGNATTGGHIYTATCNPNVPPNALPIQLVDFVVNKSENNRVAISWETISEINSDYFTLEKSHDGASWVQLATLKGAGNSTTNQYYRTEDYNPFEGINYYRLWQTDFDGNRNFSGIESINLAGNQEFLVAPNPANNSCSIYGDIEDLDIQIVNTDGKFIQVQPNKITKQQIEISSEHLPDGVYFLYLRTEKINEIKKLVVKH
jgi:hypothetical protein